MKEVFNDKTGKLSAKRVVGAITYGIGLTMSIVTGFHWYNVETALILTILANGTVLLGIGTFKEHG
jgi:hypothetical protein